MLSVWFPLLTTVFMLVVLIAVAPARGHSMTKPERERLFFRQTYGLSIDRMLSESPLDRDEVRRLRDSGRRDGRVRAIRYVRKWDPSLWRSLLSSSTACERGCALDRELRSLSRTYFSSKRLLTDTSRLEDNAVLDQQVRPR